MISPIHFSGLLIIVLLSNAFTFCSANELSPATIVKISTAQQLARSYQDGIVVKNYWISEKLDGIRGRWNGTALITRNGNIINAPTWFVKNFPSETLDGELWLARNSFAKTASIILRKTPNEDWQNIKFMLFDLPEHKGDFSQRLTDLQLLVDTISSPYLQVIPQFKLENKSQLMRKLDELIEQGAEGLMLNHHGAYYQDGRSANLLKLKKHQDAEAKVIAHISGKGKYKSMMGSLLVELDSGLQFKIGSGFSDSQRQEPPQIDTVITFKYYGLTARGIPRFASFLRIKATAVNSR
ncbi:MAG: DNA ligase-1 [Oleiphilaceae bacterium]|jgi:DNA ligase-1